MLDQGTMIQVRRINGVPVQNAVFLRWNGCPIKFQLVRPSAFSCGGARGGVFGSCLKGCNKHG